MHPARLLSFCGLLLGLSGLVSCEKQTGDAALLYGAPPPGGRGDRIHEIADPKNEKKAAHRSQVSVSGAVVVAIDEFDETGKGDSAGSIYVADLGSAEPYSGLALFNPTFVPGNLRIGPGDALDLRGEYQENNDVPIQFPAGMALVQLTSPVGTFRFDAAVPEPVEIPIEDLLEYKKGRQWLNMLVTVKNVTVQMDAKPATSGRLNVSLLPRPQNQKESDTVCGLVPSPPTLVNELMSLADIEKSLKQGTVIKSLTGVVTYFCNLHIAPRTAADIVL